MAHLHFVYPHFLWLMLAAILPFIGHGIRLQSYAALHDWPADRFSAVMRWMLRGLAALALLALALAVATPYTEGGSVEKIGKGAEIVVVLDRSGSMSEGLKGHEQGRQSQNDAQPQPTVPFLSKIEAARTVLLKLMQARSADTFGVVAFNAAPISVAPLSSDRALAEAALRSAQSQSTGFTARNRALALGLDYFANRPYTATRLILLVSDGDAVIEPDDQKVLRQLFQQYRAQLVWIYVRGEREQSILDTVIAGDNEVEDPIVEAALAKQASASMHSVFQQLGMPYQAFEVDDAAGLNLAIQAVANATNKPTRYQYRLPRQDYAGGCYVLSALLMAVLFLLKRQELGQWAVPGKSIKRNLSNASASNASISNSSAYKGLAGNATSSRQQ